MAVKDKTGAGEAAEAPKATAAAKAKTAGLDLVTVTKSRAKKIRTTGGETILPNEFNLPEVACVPSGDVSKWVGAGWAESKAKPPAELVKVTKEYKSKDAPSIAYVGPNDLDKWTARNWKAA